MLNPKLVIRMALGQRPRLSQPLYSQSYLTLHFEQRGHSGLGQWVRQSFGSAKEAAV